MALAGLNLKYLRKLRGWTQEEFAIQIRHQAFTDWSLRRRKSRPRTDVLETVSKYLKLP